ncbi:MAG TPA: ParB/RepB/Spo0J family partition protein [Chloroflexota bacterium]|nr:ParB/RepB/Spo0J family partition protein [Chloroflexota bacterium]
MKRRGGGLGRGLDALLPAAPTGAVPGGVVELPVDLIVPNPEQPRQGIAEAELAELAASIRAHGVLQPVIVARAGAGYVLVAGERRWRAAQQAGLTTIPALIKEVTPRQRLELALVENLQRQDLTPLEEAAAYQQLITEHGLTQEQVAERVGKSRAAVANTLRLLQLAPAVRTALLAGQITAGHARALLGCADPAQQETLLAQVLASDLSVRATEELVRRGGPRRTRLVPAPPPELVAVEQALRQALGTKVQLLRSRRGGRIVIHYYSDEELQALYERFVAGV